MLSCGGTTNASLAAMRVGPSDRVLDVGWGAGQTTREAARLARTRTRCIPICCWRGAGSLASLVRNAGATDHAGVRSETRAETARQPVGFFQVKRQALEPSVARDAEPVRLGILLESGACVSEVLGRCRAEA
jgi:hypothetical protein